MYHGREAELAEVVAALQGGRSLQLTGTGGIGKTELLLQGLAKAETGRPVLWINVGRYKTTEAVEEALHIALSSEGEPLGSEDVPARLDAMVACVVLDGVEQGLISDLEKLEERMAELSAATHAAQFIATSQFRLHRFPAEATIVVGPLGEDASGRLLGGGQCANSRPFNKLLLICGGHALTLQLASVLILHFGTAGKVVQIIKDRGASAVRLPGVDVGNRSTSLSICLSIAFEALSRIERQALLLFALAPAGLFAKQLEDDYFRIGAGIDNVANLRRWHLVYSDHAEIRERVSASSPVRLFVAQRWQKDELAEHDRLKDALLNSVGVMVGVIAEQSDAADQIKYMISRYSEEMPNIRWLISEAEEAPDDRHRVFLGLATCSALMRYFFVLCLAEEGALVMLRAAELAIASGQPNRAPAFIAQMLALRRRKDRRTTGLAEDLLSKLDVLQGLPPNVLGDINVARAMIALNDKDPEAGAAFSKLAFQAYKQAAKIVSDRRPDDPEDLDPLPDQIIGCRREELHNDIASALKLHGDAMLALGNYTRAAEHYRHSLRHERGGAVAVNRGQTLHQIGNCESHLGNFKGAAECYIDAIGIFHFIGFREFISNATGELGFTLFDHLPERLMEITDTVFSASLEDLRIEIADAFDPEKGVDPQHCAGLSRKVFGTINVGILSGKSKLAGDWALGIAQEILSTVHIRDTRSPKDMHLRFSAMIVETPLHLAFLVREIEDSCQENGVPDKGAVRELLSICSSIDRWTRTMLHIPEWLATYVRLQLGLTNMSAGRIAEFMINLDDGIEDELDLKHAEESG